MSLLSDPNSLPKLLERALSAFYHNYGKTPPEHAVRQAYDSMIDQGRIDFGRINESLQKEILRNLVTSPNDLEDLRKQLRMTPPGKDLVAKNKESVMKNFGLEAYAERLFKLYLDILSGKNEQVAYANGERLLECFLCPTRLNLLRTK